MDVKRVTARAQKFPQSVLNGTLQTPEASAPGTTDVGKRKEGGGLGGATGGGWDAEATEKLLAVHPDPYTLNPAPQTPNPKPQTPNPESSTPNPEP